MKKEKKKKTRIRVLRIIIFMSIYYLSCLSLTLVTRNRKYIEYKKLIENKLLGTIQKCAGKCPIVN